MCVEHDFKLLLSLLRQFFLVLLKQSSLNIVK